MIRAALHLAARHARVCLIAGLLAGLLLPGLALILRGWLPEMVAAMLFCVAIRIGARAAVGSLRDIGQSLQLVLVFQAVLPLLALGGLAALGVASAPLAVAAVLVMAAPAVSASPTLTQLTGHDPAPAMRILILGTALVPLTAMPILWLSPGLGDFGAATLAALRLMVVIFASVAAGFAVRHWRWGAVLPETDRRAVDGVTAILMGVIVIGLMSALGPALRSDPVSVLWWLAAAIGVNFGLQLACRAILRDRPGAVAASIIAGNRNIALFLVALPAAVTDPILLFIGCYQVPMYLTPILLRRLYGQPAPA